MLQTVLFRSVAVYIEPRVPVRICSFQGICTKWNLFGVLVETFAERLLTTCEVRNIQLETVFEEDTMVPRVGKVAINSVDLPDHLKDLYTASRLALSEHQQQKLVEL